MQDSLIVNDVETANLRQKPSVDAEHLNAASANIVVIPSSNTGDGEDANLEHEVCLVMLCGYFAKHIKHMHA